MNRRAAMSALAGGTAVALVPAAVSATLPTSDKVWRTLIADFHATNAAQAAAWEAEEDASQAFLIAKKALPEPQSPGDGLPNGFKGLTLNEILAISDQPERKALWAAYEQDKAAHKAACAALRAEMVGTASATAEAAWARFVDARDAMIGYRVGTLADLHEKMAIVAKDYADCEIPQEYLAAFMADVRRLGGEA